MLTDELRDYFWEILDKNSGNNLITNELSENRLSSAIVALINDPDYVEMESRSSNILEFFREGLNFNSIPEMLVKCNFSNLTINSDLIRLVRDNPFPYIRFISNLFSSVSDVEVIDKDGVLDINELKAANFNKLFRLKFAAANAERISFVGCKYISTSICRSFNELKSVNLTEGVKVIGRGAFFRCINLSEIKLPENSLEEICDYAFSECMSLNSIELPASIKKISGTAFKYCQNLTIRLSKKSREIVDQFPSEGNEGIKFEFYD